MASDSANKLATVLWLVAGALALSAAIVQFVRSGEVAWGISAAGVFLLAMGLNFWLRSRRSVDPADPRLPR